MAVKEEKERIIREEKRRREEWGVAEYVRRVDAEGRRVNSVPGEDEEGGGSRRRFLRT